MDSIKNIDSASISKTPSPVQETIEQEEIHSQSSVSDGGISITIATDAQHAIVQEATQHAINNFPEEQNILSHAHQDSHIEPGSFVPISHDNPMLEVENLLKGLQTSDKADMDGIRNLANKIIGINENLLDHLTSLSSQSAASFQKKNQLRETIRSNNGSLESIRSHPEPDYDHALKTMERSLGNAREAEAFIQNVEQQYQQPTSHAASGNLEKKKSASSPSSSDVDDNVIGYVSEKEEGRQSEGSSNYYSDDFESHEHEGNVLKAGAEGHSNRVQVTPTDHHSEHSGATLLSEVTSHNEPIDLDVHHEFVERDQLVPPEYQVDRANQNHPYGFTDARILTGQLPPPPGPPLGPAPGGALGPEHHPDL